MVALGLIRTVEFTLSRRLNSIRDTIESPGEITESSWIIESILQIQLDPGVKRVDSSIMGDARLISCNP